MLRVAMRRKRLRKKGLRVMMMSLRMTPMSSPPEPPRCHGKGPAKEKPHYKPCPKKSHKASYIN
jgi:hypothetical protein